MSKVSSLCSMKLAGDIAYALYNIEVEEQCQKAEEALANKTMLLDNVINTVSNVTITTTDLDLRITLYNPIAENFLVMLLGKC